MAARFRLGTVASPAQSGRPARPGPFRHGGGRRVPPRQRGDADLPPACLRHLRPRVLPRPHRDAGASRRPGRADWFDGRTAVELRLWEALERGLLAPFQYFGVHDGPDLQHRALEARPRLRLRGADQPLHRPRRADQDHPAGACRQGRPIFGGCGRSDSASASTTPSSWLVGSTHAGIPRRAVTSRTAREDRQAALEALRDATVNVLFTVDLFNEGVDVPEVDTVLFLRPTESATIFLQQLGRGLRLAEDKPCLTVFDFIGNQQPSSASTCGTGRSLASAVVAWSASSSTASPPCPLVVTSSSTGSRSTWYSQCPFVAADRLARAWSPSSDASATVPSANSSRRPDSISMISIAGAEVVGLGLRRQAGLEQRPPGADDDRLAAAIGRMLHLDDQERLDLLGHVLRQPQPPVLHSVSRREQRLLSMLHFSLWGAGSPLDQLADASDDCGRTRAAARSSPRSPTYCASGSIGSRVRSMPPPGFPFRSMRRTAGMRRSPPSVWAIPRRSDRRVKWVEEEQADVFFFDAPQDRDSTTPQRRCTRIGQSLRRCSSGSHRAPHR